MTRSMVIGVLVLSCILALSPATRGAPALTVDAAVASSRSQGGICVVLGDVNPEWTAKLAVDRPFLVRSLMKNPASIAPARESLLKQNLYGVVAVDALTAGPLPFADQLVSLVIAMLGSNVDEAEMLRILRPGGELIMQTSAGVVVKTKPKVAGTDEWTHWRHGPDRNPVSKDSVVDVPGRIQWLQSSELNGEQVHMVAANGRAFVQDKDLLTARDAFNGLPLWTFKLRKGTEFSWGFSQKLSSVVVASGERVYVVAEDQKFKALDAATGKPVITYDQADIPIEVAVIEDPAGGAATVVVTTRDAVKALDAATGKLLWSQDATKPRTLIASNKSVYFVEGLDKQGDAAGTISCRELKTGKPIWTRSYEWARRTELGSLGYDRIAFEMRNPVNWKELYADPKKKAEDRYAIVVINATTGDEIQKVRDTGTSARHGEFRAAFWHNNGLITEANAKEGLSLVKFGLTDFTKPAEMFKANFQGDRGFGHCYPPVLTEHFYLNGQLDFTNLDSHTQASNQITRGACNTSRSGYVPANGMIYTFPKHCVCFPMLDGNVCLAPKEGKSTTKPANAAPETELTQGPGWPAKPTSDDPGDWPTFRHDAYRSGGVAGAIATDLKPVWTSTIATPDYRRPITKEWEDNPYTAGPVSAPVVAGGMVYVAQPDSHRLIALDEKTGAERWHFIADARIDGPPTIASGMCLFGSRGGYVYHLRAADGMLVWKLRVAPAEKRISVYGQTESPWPVPGSVLVVDGLAYVAAGIHPNSDGGIRVFCIEPATGKIVWQNKFDDMGFDAPWPDPYDPRKTRPESDPWRTIRPPEYRYFDLPARDGDFVAISRCRFDLKTGKIDLAKTSGFLKLPQAWMPRIAWRYSTERLGSPASVARGKSVYGTIPATGTLFRSDFDPAKPFDTDWVIPPKGEETGTSYAIGQVFRMGTTWTTKSADAKRSFNRAMLATDSHLLVAGPKGVLTIHDAASGNKAGEIKTSTLGWDAMAVARGKLFVTTAEGKVVCYGGK